MSVKPSFILSEQQSALLDALSQQLDQHSLLWTSGYLAGLAVGKAGAFEAPISGKSETIAEKQSLTIVYGSQTGNAKRLAESFVKQTQAAGFVAKLVDASEYKVKNLKDEKNLLIVISTQGDGESPDNAIAFVEHIHSKRAPKLEQLNYAVIALGDSSYPLFCNIGKELDKRLNDLGAKRFNDFAACDLDIETVAEPWFEQSLAWVKNNFDKNLAPSATVTPLHPAKKSSFNRDNPFKATLLENQRITASNTDKNIFHIELSLEGSDLTYKPGDALGVWPTNNKNLVQAILTELNFDGQTPVKIKNDSVSLIDALTHRREITSLAKPFLTKLADKGEFSAVNAALAENGREQLVELLNTYQLIDALKQFPSQWSEQEFIDALRPLTPRLYSIASSQTAVEDEVHLTVAKVQYEAHGFEHLGCASAYLEELEIDSQVPVYIEENKHFKLPEDSSRNVIMVGPGTGIAPFRAFVQERSENEATGKNWLFFGAQHFYSQFLYQTEWQAALKEKTLDRISLAFSRDQEQKVYVQHKIIEQGKDLYQWLEDGAYFYVCGSTDMEKDVEAALKQVLQQEAGKTEQQAQDYISDLKKAGRYNRDVY